MGVMGASQMNKFAVLLPTAAEAVAGPAGAGHRFYQTKPGLLKGGWARTQGPKMQPYEETIISLKMPHMYRYDSKELG